MMPGEPQHSVFGRWYRRPRRNIRAADHDHWEAEHASGFDFGKGGVAAGVLRENHLDPVFAEEADVFLRGEGSACVDENNVRQIGRRCWHIDEPDHIAMLRGSLEAGQSEAADAAKHFAGCGPKRGDSFRHTGDLDPAILRLLSPSGPFDREKRPAGHRGGLDGITAHLAREGMRGIDHEIDAPGFEVSGKPFRAAKTAGARGDGLGARRCRAAREREDRLEANIGCEQPRERACFGRAAQNEDTYAPRV
jgi:hypothetical protein